MPPIPNRILANIIVSADRLSCRTYTCRAAKVTPNTCHLLLRLRQNCFTLSIILPTLGCLHPTRTCLLLDRVQVSPINKYLRSVSS